MPHHPSPSCVSSAACPNCLWSPIARQLRRRRLPPPLQLHAALLSLPAPLQQAVQARFFAAGNVEPQDLHHSTGRVHVHRGMVRLRSLLSSLRALFVPVYAPLATGAVGAVMLAQVSLSPHRAPLMIAAASEPTAKGMAAMAQATSRPTLVGTTRRAETNVPPSTSADKSVPTPQVFDFDDDAVEGDLQGADITIVQVPLTSKHKSLLEIPATMIGPLLKSLEDI